MERNQKAGEIGHGVVGEEYRLALLQRARSDLYEARTFVRMAGSVETPKAIQRAIKSLDGAIRHQDRRVVCAYEGRELKRRGASRS
jgi:hypothetical protein